MVRNELVTTFDHGWPYMKHGIDTIQNILEGLDEPRINSHLSSDDCMRLYTLIYNMCTQGRTHDYYSQQLYEKYRETFEEYITGKVLPSLREKHGEFLLRELVRRWTNHKLMVRWLWRFFHYLDRYFIIGRKLPTLKDISFRCFLDLVYKEFNVKARDAVISLIEREREGEQVDRALLKNVLDIFLEMGKGEMTYYVNDFEKSMLKDSADYYSRKASNWILEYSYSKYMSEADECLKREKDRAAHYLHSSSEANLLMKVQHELVSVYAPQLLDKEHSGFRDFLRYGKVEDLSIMFGIFLKIPRGVEPVSVIFKLHLIDEGTSLVKQAEDSASNKKAFVRNVLELYDKFTSYVNVCFQNHTSFHMALKEAFEIFCNKCISGSSSAELLASFCDNILKKGGSEKLSDEAIEDTLEKVLKLLECIVDKDLFGEFYRKKFSRRLLFDKSGNYEHEISFLAKLKQQCGANFTSKMEGMLKDLTLARENQAGFKEYLSHNPNAIPEIDFTVTVLTTVFWPPYKTFDLHLPSDMAKCAHVFREFYKSKTENRKLSFMNSLGTCSINGTFDQQTIELNVTTHQAATLMLFNTSDKLSYQEIVTQLNLPDEDVLRLLHSLSCGRYQILNKDPNTKTISPTDTFEYNSKFTNKMRKIKIPLPPLDEKKKVIEGVDRDRSYAIDASIVRIMKSRKVLGYEQLVSECIEQLNRMFKPDVKAIMKRIDSLIAREYLERDKDNLNMFKYLA